jgi:hypothetical protein
MLIDLASMDKTVEHTFLNETLGIEGQKDEEKAQTKL